MNKSINIFFDTAKCVFTLFSLCTIVMRLCGAYVLKRSNFQQLCRIFS